METILHVSDTHLGKRQYRSDQRREDYADAFERAIEVAIEEDVDAVLHTGDLFDDKNPSLGTQIRCTEIINRLHREPNQPIPFLAIVGNHERKRDHQFVDYIELSSQHLVQLDNQSNSPYIIDNEVAIYGFDHVPQSMWDTTDFTLKPSDDSHYVIVCMHQLLHPPVPDIQADHETEEILDRFNLNVDALALGDYHQHIQKMINGTLVYYPGVTEKVADDDGPNHYVDLLEIEDGELASHSRREIPTREFVFITVDLVEGLSPVEQVEDKLDAYDLANKVVKVTLAGADLPITRPQVHTLLQERDVTVSRVADDRSGIDIDAEAVDYEVQDIESTLDTELDSMDLSDTTRHVDEIVRDLTTIPKSNVRDEAEQAIEDAAPGALADVEVDKSEEST